jgi:hypothetical protein
VGEVLHDRHGEHGLARHLATHDANGAIESELPPSRGEARCRSAELCGGLRTTPKGERVARDSPAVTPGVTYLHPADNMIDQPRGGMQ